MKTLVSAFTLVLALAFAALSSRRRVFVAVAYSPMLRGFPPAASASAISHQTASCVARRMIML